VVARAAQARCGTEEFKEFLPRDDHRDVGGERGAAQMSGRERTISTVVTGCNVVVSRMATWRP